MLGKDLVLGKVNKWNRSVCQSCQPAQAEGSFPDPEGLRWQEPHTKKPFLKNLNL